MVQAIMFYYYVVLGWKNRSGLRRILRRYFSHFPISKLYFAHKSNDNCWNTEGRSENN